ncbi:hypothetical protein LOD99_12909 [Oopsacas minuta]|uniref:Uncharacterized protein n=1 Tax=Oopsacas minuta TaxID=111878 RepID=A0AAV7IWK0_9METZ|nr:hypothetical protein LOD99_12909 [Oopsacas minuta]
MGRKSDIIGYVKTLDDYKTRLSLRTLLALLQKEDVFIRIEAIDLNIILRSVPEISKAQADKIKKHKRLLRKRVAKKGFEDRTKVRYTDLKRGIESLTLDKKRLLEEKLGLQNEVRVFSRNIILEGVAS